MAKKKNKEELLKKFIEWAQEESEDAWWIYENTEEAIEQFLDQEDNG